MKIIEFLHKIGITNFGSAPPGRSGDKDATEEIMIDVSNSKKDRDREDTGPSPA